MAAWKNFPAAMANNVKFKYTNNIANFFRYYAWNYGWSGRQRGLHFHDQAFEPAPEVKEALRRLRLRDPYQYDQRLKRILLAEQLALSNERLPKDQWTKWDEETFYLKPYVDEIEAEKLERGRSSGIKPGYQLKPQL